MKLKRTFRLPPDVIDQLAAFASRRRVGQPDIVEAALRSFMSPDNPEQLEAALSRRLDHIDRRIAALDQQVNGYLEGYQSDPSKTPSNSALLIDVVGRSLGYRGDTLEYFSSGNSLFDHVIDNRLGIPISLAAIYMSVGQRLGIKVHGVGFPGHFLIRVIEPDGSERLVDPFSHHKLSTQDVTALRASTGEQFGQFDEAWLANAHPHDMLVRMFENLKRVFLNEGNIAAAESCLDYQLILKPKDSVFLEQLQVLLDQRGHGVH